MKTSILNLVTLLVFILLAIESKPQANSQSPQARAGILDLRQFNFHENDPLPLEGDWKIQPGLIRDWPSEVGTLIHVPGSWTGIEHNGISMPAQGTGTYFLSILLPPDSGPLALFLPEISTAFELWVNGQLVAQAGKIGEEGETVPLYKPQSLDLPVGTDTLQIMIRVANFHRWRGGLLHSPILGNQQAIAKLNTYSILEGGVIYSILTVLGFIFIGFFAFRPKEKYYLWFAVTAFLIAINVAQLTLRWGYLLLGERGWQWAYRLEYLFLFGVFVSLILMFSSFYPNLVSNNAKKRLFIFAGLEAGFVLMAPFPFVTWVEFIVLSNYLIITFGILLTIRAFRQKREAALLFLILLVASMLPWILGGAILGEPVGEIQPLHYGLAGILLSVALVLVRRSGRAFTAVEILSQDLAITNDELEKANAALAAHNRSLEEEVQKRSEQLVAIEKKTYEMELERKKRDMETLSANNLMKLKLKRNLIRELENLQKKPQDLEREIKLMTFDLKRQVATEEKIGTLQGDMDRVNSEFYTRLQKRFPKLNKTERELCAYIKLNLSSQEIADLRNTTLNSINVTRYRLRKKLGLEKGVELQAFIQTI